MIIRVSVSNSGQQGDGDSRTPALSADGRTVAFGSMATGLVDDKTSAVHDIYVRDGDSGALSRVSRSTSGEQANGHCYRPSLSADGTRVAFWSDATNLGVNSFDSQAFVHDRTSGTTTCVSTSAAGVAGNHASFSPALSGDGRFVAFDSMADNLVPGDRNGHADVVVKELQSGVVQLASVSSEGRQGNDMSFGAELNADGRYVVFESFASNLVPGDTNYAIDVFVRDLQSGTTSRVSVSSRGEEGDFDSQHPSISADGRYIAFESRASNLVDNDTNRKTDIFVHDRQSGATTRVSVNSEGQQANGHSYRPCISGDGRYVVFHSSATNLVADDTNGADDVFLHDRQTGRTVRVSEGTTQANGDSAQAVISSNGAVVAFASDANNLTEGDTNRATDVFVTT